MKKIDIFEVGPRDGFQNIAKLIPTEMKKRIIDGLTESGMAHIQICSFISPKAIPQMRDAQEVAEYCVSRYPDSDLLALVPNLKGAKSAYEAGIRHISYVVSLSESHNKTNTNRTRKESLRELADIMDTYPDLKICVDIATAFGCPFAPGASGNTATEDLVYMFHRMGYDTGIDFDKLLELSKYQKSVIQGSYSGHHAMIQDQKKRAEKGGGQTCTAR